MGFVRNIRCLIPKRKPHYVLYGRLLLCLALFAFITSWNEFIGALILMNHEESFTVPVMMTGVMTGNFGAINWGGLQASVIISILPCMVVYLLLQRYYISGLLSGAVK